VGCTQPEIKRKLGVDEISVAGSSQHWTQYSATEQHRAKADVRRMLALAPHEVPASFAVKLFLLFSFAALRDRCSLYERVRSKVTPRYTG